VFYLCGEKCPLEYAKQGVWILHHKGRRYVKLGNTTELNPTLDRVIDGGAFFEMLDPSQLLTNTETL
jgi:hypothetical protein